jgi:prepilin-type N-terminal cleavage/methylation domain-containing protein
MTSTTSNKGFTLMESVIAIGIVAILLTTFLAVFGPATQGIRKAISVQEADRLTSALEFEFQIIRPVTDQGFTTTFAKAFNWIREAGDPAEIGADGDSKIFLYNYKGDPDMLRGDGTLGPYTGTGKIPGRDFVVQSGVRRSGDINLPSDLEAITGPIYFVQTTQLVFEVGSLVLGEPGKIVDPHDTTVEITDPDEYPEAVIALNAQFYLLRSNSANYVTGIFDPTDPETLGTPLFSRNLAVRR